MAVVFKSPQMCHCYVLYFMKLRIFFLVSCVPFLWTARQQGLKAVYFPCATSPFLDYAWKILLIPPFFRIAPDVHCCRQICDVLTDTEFTLFYEQRLKIFLAGLKCCQCHSVVFHCLISDDKSSASFFDSALSLMKYENSFCVILCLSTNVKFGKIQDLLK